jgi:tRNA pseudouridine32 synthase/23S rRNA pseudouridine746 synthase
VVSELEIIHNDSAFLLINKPGGLLSVPGRGEENQDCVVTRAQKLFPDLPGQPAVHRLDLHTSGLMLLARTPQALNNLMRQFQYRLVVKRYIGVIEGDPVEISGTIELAFRLDPENRPYQVYDPVNGKQGVTLWKKIAGDPRGSRIEFTPLTGRTHQLRLHASHPRGLGYPIVGDYLYGSGNDGDPMLLHACSLSFSHPSNGKPCVFESAPPF